MRNILIFWVMLLVFTGQASAQFTVVPKQFAISTTPATPGTAFTGQTGNGYLENFSTDTDINVSFVLQAFDSAGKRVAIKRPNFPTAKVRLEPMYENQGVMRTSGLGGNQYIDLTGSVFSDPSDLNPNPTTGGAWIYGTDMFGNVVTPTGEPIADPRFVLMNDTYRVRSTNLEVWEIHVINANRKVWPQLVSGYNNLRVNRSQFNAFVRVWASDIRIDSWLNATNGCTKYASYNTDALKYPTLYVGNEKGPVRPSLEIISYTQGQFLLKNARVITGELCRSPDMRSWLSVQPSQMQIENLINGDTRITLVNGSGSTTTRHNLIADGDKCFYNYFSKE